LNFLNEKAQPTVQRPNSIVDTKMSQQPRSTRRHGDHMSAAQHLNNDDEFDEHPADVIDRLTEENEALRSYLDRVLLALKERVEPTDFATESPSSDASNDSDVSNDDVSSDDVSNDDVSNVSMFPTRPTEPELVVPVEVTPVEVVPVEVVPVEVMPVAEQQVERRSSNRAWNAIDRQHEVSPSPSISNSISNSTSTSSPTQATSEQRLVRVEHALAEMFDVVGELLEMVSEMRKA
jgi:hypothetical protein